MNAASRSLLRSAEPLWRGLLPFLAAGCLQGAVVVFNPNGGSGTSPSVSFSPNNQFNLPINTLTRGGYTFAYWNTAADGSGVDYADGASVSPSGDLILYAQWNRPTAATRATSVVTSRDGSKVYVISGNSLQLFNSANGEILASVTTATDSRALALSPDGRRLYVTCYADASNNRGVAVYDVSSNSINLISTLNISPRLPTTLEIPPSIELNADGSRAYVVNTAQNLLSVVNTTDQPISQTSLATGPEPRDLKLSPDGTKAYICNAGDSTISILDLTAATPRISDSFTLATGVPTKLAISPDGKRLYVLTANVNTLQVLDLTAAPRRVVASLDVGSSAFDVLASPAGDRLYVSGNAGTGLRVFDSSGSGSPSLVAQHALLQRAASPMALTPDLSRLYLILPVANAVLETRLGAAKTKVDFLSNTGSGYMPPQFTTQGQSAALRSNSFTKAGCSFYAWDTAADGSGADYADAASYGFGADSKLYVQWLATPANVTALVSTQGIYFSWANVSGARQPDNYIIQARKGGDWYNYKGDFQTDTKLPGDVNQLLLNDLDLGTSYDLRVQALLGSSTQTSSVVSATTYDVPTAPTNVGVWRMGNTNFYVYWHAASAAAAVPVNSYDILLRQSGSDYWSVISTADGSANMVNIELELTYGTTYKLAVRANNDMGSGPISNQADYLPRKPPGNCTNVKGNARGGGWATLRWGPPADTGGLPISWYIAYYRRTNDSNKTWLGYDSTHPPTVSINMKLARGAWTKYDIGVKAYNDVGESPDVIYDTIRNY